jgi:hypothetical protein
MSEQAYLDFDLLVARSEDGTLSARVVDSPAGQAVHEFELPFSDLEVENFLLRVGQTRGRTRRLESSEMESARQFGGRLYDALFDGEVRTAFRRSLDDADRQQKGLRVRLRLNDAPEVADLPWEFLYSSGLNRFLALSTDTPLVRYMDLPSSSRPLTVTPPLRILVMISSPTDYPELDVAAEWTRLQCALQELADRGLVELDKLEDASLSRLQQRLRQGDYHIFHFIGHGAFDEREQDGVLMLEDDQERGRRVSGHYLGTLLHDHRSMQLAVLNSCEGARAARDDPFAGTAQSLVQQGIPAVIAMQFEITDDAAIGFAQEFYAAIADGYPVDAALGEARKAIFAGGNDVEWGTPVLYLRSGDGKIFDVDQSAIPAVDAGQQQRLADLYQRATSALSAGEPEAAVALLEELEAEQPDFRDVSSLIEDARLHATAGALYQAAKDLSDAENWQAARTKLDELHEMDSGFGDPEHLGARLAARLKERAGSSPPAETPESTGGTVRLTEETDLAPPVGSPGSTVDTIDEVKEEPHGERRPDGGGRPGLASWWAKLALWKRIQFVGVPLLALLVVVVVAGGNGATDQTTTTAADTSTTATTGGTTTAVAAVTVTMPGGVDPATHVVGLRAAEQPTINGDLTDWPSWPEGLVAVSRHPVYASGWDGTEDMEARWFVQWDDDNLYVAALVSDDRHVQNQTGFFIFRGDSLDLRFDTDRDGDDDFDNSDYELQLSPGDLASLEPSAALFVGNGAGFSNSVVPENVTIGAVGRAEDDGFVLEASIPWSVLSGRPAVGELIGLALQANDIDVVVDPARQELMISNLSPPAGHELSDAGFINEPRSFGTFHLDSATACEVTGGC